MIKNIITSISDWYKEFRYTIKWLFDNEFK